MNDKNDYTVHLITGEDNAVVNTDPINNIIGQDEVCNKMSFFLESHSEEVPFPTMLFTGSQGLGKSYTAAKIADALGRELIEINCRSIDSTKQFIEDVLFARVVGPEPKTLLLDESHNLCSDITDTLLTLLNPNKDNVNYYNYKNWTIEYDLSKINLIFATTDAHKMFRPLINRCEEVYFHSYDNDELFEILNFYLPEIKLRCSKKDISDACRGRARDAFILSQNVRRYCKMKKVKTLDKKGWENIKGIFNIYPCGLNSQEIKLMNILANDAPISCRNIAIRLGVNESNVESELELRPRELGFIENSSRGRLLTDNGKQYITQLA